MVGPKPRILFFDLETMAHTAYVWGKYDQNVIAFKEYGQIISIAWKWNTEKVQSMRIEGESDLSLCKKLWSLLQEADIVVAHNGKAFDIKKSKTRFLFHKLPPLKRLAVVDTKLVAKARFGFVSNSLNDLASYLGIGQKVSHEGFALWQKCMAGCKKAWKKMQRYNERDVELLYKVYKRMRPWIEDHPNVSRLQERNGCPNCGSSNVKKQGLRANHAGIRQQMQCKSCKGWYLTRYQGPS